MRIYTLGNDGIIPCRRRPAALNEGKIVVASQEELRGASLSGKRLLALWNTLPGVEKRKRLAIATRSLMNCGPRSRRCPTPISLPV
jgi:hypothetical protein